ncbi:MAG: hypothetical protein IJO29_06515 [Oscillospiraceae bacterium]|nr:hypothetical protein [Oscillospiraceae bacterium]
MQKTKNILLTLVLLFLMLFSVIYSDSLKYAVSCGVKVCLETIVPSLYFFMVISSMLVDSPFIDIFSKISNKFAKAIFGFDGKIFSIFLLSQFGGYPIGIKLLSLLYEKGEITRRRAMRYACFCFSSGPAFILGVVSHKSQLSAILISCTLSNLIAAILLCRFSTDSQPVCIARKPIGISLVKSAKSAADALLNICIMILFMRAALSIVQNLGIITLISRLAHIPASIVASVFEVTYVLTVISVPACAALLSFGGICVALQLRSIASFRFDMAKFVAARAVCAVISAVICNAIYEPPAKQYISVIAPVQSAGTDSDILQSSALILMCCILLAKNSRQMKNNML